MIFMRNLNKWCDWNDFNLNIRQAEGQAKSCLERIEKAEKKSMGTQEDGHETEPHICGWSMIWNY